MNVIVKPRQGFLAITLCVRVCVCVSACLPVNKISLKVFKQSTSFLVEVVPLAHR